MCSLYSRNLSLRDAEWRSLMSGVGAPIAILGIILPIYTIIDMIETAENVWSDSCVAAIVNSYEKEPASPTPED